MMIFLCSFLLGFSSAHIYLNEEMLKVELATNEEQRKRGLMERTTLPDGCGMLFVFEKPHILSFWMKNTKIPLSIAFFDAARKLINTEEMEVPQNENQLRPYYSKGPALYALEVPQGWFERHSIKPGVRFEFDQKWNEKVDRKSVEYPPSHLPHHYPNSTKSAFPPH